MTQATEIRRPSYICESFGSARLFEATPWSVIIGAVSQFSVGANTHTLEVNHVDSSWIWAPQFTRPAGQSSQIGQNCQRPLMAHLVV